MFGDKLRFYRENANLRQEELADAINVTRATVSNWENGKSFPDGDKLLEISEMFGVPTDVLLGKKVDEGELEIIKAYLKQAGIMKNLDDLTMEELKHAVEYVVSMKEIYKKNNDGNE